MKCTNCGNLVAPAEEMCATCGTENPAGASLDHNSPVEQASVSTDRPAPRLGLMVGLIVAGLVLVGGVFVALVARSVPRARVKRPTSAQP